MNVRLRRYPTKLRHYPSLTRAMESGLAIRAYAASRSYWRLRPSDQGSQIRLGSLPHDLVSAIFFSTMPRYRPSFRSQRITSANAFSSKIAADERFPWPIPYSSLPHPIRWRAVTQGDALDQSRESLLWSRCVHANMERVSEGAARFHP